MEVNPIKVWYKKDQRLLKILVDIDNKGLSDEESAREAFYKVSEMYGLPKFPDEVEHEDDWEDDEPRSVFEEIALARYMFPEDLSRGLVMLAIHNIHTKCCIPFDDVAAKYYGSHDDIPDSYFMYFFGKDVDAFVKLDIEGQAWTDAGAVMMKKVIKVSFD